MPYDYLDKEEICSKQNKHQIVFDIAIAKHLSI